MRNRKSWLTPLARVLRKGDNVAERKLWNAIRNRQVNGIKFLRQVPIEPYIADFACRELKLVIELDGSQHIDDPHDVVRNDSMIANGWSVARFPSGSPLQNLDSVIQTIEAICDGRITDRAVEHDFQFYPAMTMNIAESEKDDDTHMRRAIAVAMTQAGRTWPNPAVGCVIVRDGAVIAEAATGDGGRPHAEEQALETAGAAAQGATVYVTLEPCGQRSNGGCSCSQRLVEAGIARVVYACEDPSPYASHIGSERMKAANLAVESGLLAEEAERLIAPTAHYHRTKLPLVETSETGEGFDAEYTAGSDPVAELTEKAALGYRHLWIKPNSETDAKLREIGLLTE